MAVKTFENLGRDLRDSILRILRDYAEALVLAIFMAVILRLFVFSAYKIVNPNMEPNLKMGDFIIGYKLPYGITVPFSEMHLGQSEPRRGDILVFECPQSPEMSCIKRVVALAGDRVEIRGKRLIVNGTRADYNRSETKPSVILQTQSSLVTLDEKWNQSERAILISGSNENEEYGPYIVPPQTFFALGDNRDFSEDSRHWGGVPYRSVQARAVFIWLSIEWLPKANRGFSSSLRWSRLFSWVH